jgi:hypothetical protein
MTRQFNLGSHEVRHEFLYLPDFPVGLISRDLLFKLRAQITFDSDVTSALKLRGPKAKTLILTVAQEEGWQLSAPEGRLIEIPELPFRIPGVWAEDNSPGLAQNVPQVVVQLKLGVTPVSQKWYFIPCKAKFRIQKHFDRLLKYGILWPCQSSWDNYQSRNQGLRISG